MTTANNDEEMIRNRRSHLNAFDDEVIDNIEEHKRLRRKEEKHWTYFGYLAALYAQEVIIFLGMLVAAYFLRFQKDMLSTYYFPLSNCSDPQYSYPYIQEEEASINTNIRINNKAFYCVTFLAPLAILFIGELIHHVTKFKKSTSPRLSTFLSATLPRRLFRFSFVFVMGIFASSIATDSIKIVSSSPRPYFLSVCQPSGKLCDDYPFNSDIICRGEDKAIISEARYSFPSFYASHTMYIAVFMAMYVHLVFDFDKSYTIRPVLVGTSIVLGLLSGFTRYQLNYNHWQDLLIGYLLGTGVAVYMVVSILNKFEKPTRKKIIIHKSIIPDMTAVPMTRDQESQVAGSSNNDSRPYTNLPEVALDKDAKTRRKSVPPPPMVSPSAPSLSSSSVSLEENRARSDDSESDSESSVQDFTPIVIPRESLATSRQESVPPPSIPPPPPPPPISLTSSSTSDEEYIGSSETSDSETESSAGEDPAATVERDNMIVLPSRVRLLSQRDRQNSEATVHSPVVDLGTEV